MKRSKSKNLYFQWLSRESFFGYKNKKTNATTWPNMLEKAYFWKVTAKKLVNHSEFNETPFSLIRGITLEENGDLKNDTNETTEVFSNCYVNIIEITSGKRPSSIGNCNSQCQDELP